MTGNAIIASRSCLIAASETRQGCARDITGRRGHRDVSSMYVDGSSSLLRPSLGVFQVRTSVPETLKAK